MKDICWLQPIPACAPAPSTSPSLATFEVSIAYLYYSCLHRAWQLHVDFDKGVSEFEYTISGRLVHQALKYFSSSHMIYCQSLMLNFFSYG
jgi:hypothetical protein